MNNPDEQAALHGLSDLHSLTATRPDWFTSALAVPRREHRVQVDGGYIHGFSWGDPNNPPVLFTHGMMAHSRCWAFIAPLLAKDFHLAAYDISGMGDSSWFPSYSYEQRAAQALAFADALAMERPHLVCHSFGGSVGMQCAETFPDAFRSLTVCDMTMLSPDDAADFLRERAERGGISKPRERNRVYPTLVEAMARFRLAPEQPCANDFLFEYMAYHSLKAHDGGFCWKFDPRVLQPERLTNDDWWLQLAPRFASLALPRAMVYGAKSALFGARNARYVRALTQGQVPVVGIEDAHHHVMLDQPIALAGVLSSLLQNHERSITR